MHPVDKENHKCRFADSWPKYPCPACYWFESNQLKGESVFRWFRDYFGNSHPLKSNKSSQSKVFVMAKKESSKRPFFENKNGAKCPKLYRKKGVSDTDFIKLMTERGWTNLDKVSKHWSDDQLALHSGPKDKCKFCKDRAGALMRAGASAKAIDKNLVDDAKPTPNNQDVKVLSNPQGGDSKPDVKIQGKDWLLKEKETIPHLIDRAKEDKVEVKQQGGTKLTDVKSEASTPEPSNVETKTNKKGRKSKKLEK